MHDFSRVSPHCEVSTWSTTIMLGSYRWVNKLQASSESSKPGAASTNDWARHGRWPALHALAGRLHYLVAVPFPSSPRPRPRPRARSPIQATEVGMQKNITLMYSRDTSTISYISCVSSHTIISYHIHISCTVTGNVVQYSTNHLRAWRGRIAC